MNEKTEQAHRDMKNVLLAGRILINGMPLTGNELGILIQEEQMLYQKASQFDAASELAAKQAKPPKDLKKNLGGGGKIVQIKDHQEQK